MWLKPCVNESLNEEDCLVDICRMSKFFKIYQETFFVENFVIFKKEFLMNFRKLDSSWDNWKIWYIEFLIDLKNWNYFVFLRFLEFQEAFQLFDSRGDGKIHVSQIGDALRALGQNPTESDVKKFTHQHKPDERISFEVFLPIYQAISKARTSDTADDFIEGLRHFDKDGNGFISSAELRHLLTTLGK